VVIQVSVIDLRRYRAQSDGGYQDRQTGDLLYGMHELISSA
jgi:hypothetical protein